jgi:hypothetical protein
MNDREICEKIIDQGNCSGIECVYNDCPLSSTKGETYKCGGFDNCSGTAKQWLIDNPEKDIEAMVEEFDNKQGHELMTYAEKQQNNLSTIRKIEKTVADEMFFFLEGDDVCYARPDGDFDICDGKISKEVAKSLSKWLTKMLKES